MTPDAALLEHALARAVGTSVRIRMRSGLGGGDISVVERIDTTAGSFVVKSGAGVAGLFQAEADGLRAVRASGTSLRIPDVIMCHEAEPAFLVLEDLGQGSPVADFADRVGRGLAELHGTSAPTFGFATDNFCGATPQPNPRRSSWIEFYRSARLGHQLELGTRAGHYSTDDRRRVAALLARLDTWIDEPDEGPALVHGDLWSGNLHTAADGLPALIDPAAYFAHREAELGMMTLFGGFSSRVYAAYQEARPLEPGWRDRNPLYQLYHLMNHVTLFGGGYHGQVMAIVRRYAPAH